ncbi:MAG: VanZ family protein [Actinobacteria bacterium]|nr:VanZ family protein [Actinomycetota bacterium]
MILGVYVLALGVIALSPVSPIRGLDLSQQLDSLGLGWVTYTQLESFANVMLFVPFGLLIALLVPTSWWWLVVLGLIAVAGGIELGQALFLPGRVPSLDDVIANSTGGVAGVLIAAVIRGIGWAIRTARRVE